MSSGMREQMPICAAFVDELRAAFGQAEIDNVIRRGLRPDCDPEHRVFFSEGGASIGQRLPVSGNAVAVAQMVVGPLPVVSTRRGCP